MKFAIKIYKDNKEVFSTDYNCTWHQAEVILNDLKYKFSDDLAIWVNENRTAHIIAENGMPF